MVRRSFSRIEWGSVHIHLLKIINVECVSSDGKKKYWVCLLFNCTYMESTSFTFESPLLRCECVDDRAGVLLRQSAKRDGDSAS